MTLRICLIGRHQTCWCSCLYHSGRRCRPLKRYFRWANGVRSEKSSVSAAPILGARRRRLSAARGNVPLGDALSNQRSFDKRVPACMSLKGSFLLHAAPKCKSKCESRSMSRLQNATAAVLSSLRRRGFGVYKKRETIVTVVYSLFFFFKESPQTNRWFPARKGCHMCTHCVLFLPKGIAASDDTVLVNGVRTIQSSFLGPQVLF